MEDEGSINTYIDRSTKTIDVEIRFKRGAIEGWDEDRFINFLKLKSKTTQRLVVLDFNGTSIRQYPNPESLIQAFVEWRLGWFTLRYQKQIADLTRELNFAKAIKLCADGGLPKFLPQAQNRLEVLDRVEKLVKSIPLESDQLDRIVGLPSYRWARDSVEKIVEDIVRLNQEILALEQILNDPRKIRDNYKKEVQTLLKSLAKTKS